MKNSCQVYPRSCQQDGEMKPPELSGCVVFTHTPEEDYAGEPIAGIL